MLNALQRVHIVMLLLGALILSLELSGTLQHSMMSSISEVVSLGVIGAMVTLVLRLTRRGDDDNLSNVLMRLYKRWLFNKTFLVVTNLILFCYAAYTTYNFLNFRSVIFYATKNATIAVQPEGLVKKGTPPVAVFTVAPDKVHIFKREAGPLFYEVIDDSGKTMKSHNVPSIFDQWQSPEIHIE